MIGDCYQTPFALDAFARCSHNRALLSSDLKCSEPKSAPIDALFEANDVRGG